MCSPENKCIPMVEGYKSLIGDGYKSSPVTHVSFLEFEKCS